MASIDTLTLGAGRDVGRSCVVVHIAGTYIMFDCGMHLSYRDARRFPDFTLLPFTGRMTEMITAVVITHFHLDHCAALPFFTQRHGYQGPIYMTHPTKAIMPIILEDYQKIMTDRMGDAEWYTQDDVAECMQRVIGVDLHQVVQVAPGVQLQAFMAGHVLGAAMFLLRVGSHTVLYTGDYNTSADRHLGSASCRRLRPDLLITESTYATTLREGKKARERQLVSEVHRCASAGGKVLIPVFAGRAQELMLLIEDAWVRLGLAGRVPLYISGAMTGRANALYKSCVNWASEAVRDADDREGAFEFRGVQPWERSLLTRQGPCVLFATPGMLNGGVSLEVFKAWAPHPENLVILPGYQAAGTVGGKLMSGNVSEVQVGAATVSVKCKVRFASFSAHADVKGILQLVAATSPRAVMLVHGEKRGMQFLAATVDCTFRVPCTLPRTGDWAAVRTAEPSLPLSMCLGQAWPPSSSAPASTPLAAPPSASSTAAPTLPSQARHAGWAVAGGADMPGTPALDRDDVAVQAHSIPTMCKSVGDTAALAAADLPGGCEAGSDESEAEGDALPLPGPVRRVAVQGVVVARLQDGMAVEPRLLHPERDAEQLAGLAGRHMFRLTLSS